jgi:hypothetical protein
MMSSLVDHKRVAPSGRRKPWLVIVAAALSITCARTPTRDLIPLSGSATLVVRVVDSTTGKGLEFVFVPLTKDSLRGRLIAGDSYTDSLGKVTFVGLEAGKYFLRTLRIGYSQRRVDLTLVPGVNRLELRTAAAAVMFGPDLVFDDRERPRTSGRAPPRPNTANLDSLHDANAPRSLYILVLDFRTANILDGYGVILHSAGQENWGPIYPGDSNHVSLLQPPLGPIMAEAICPGGPKDHRIAGSGTKVIVPREMTVLQIMIDPRSCATASRLTK